MLFLPRYRVLDSRKPLFQCHYSTVGFGHPALDIALTLDKFEIPGALRITVTHAVLSTSYSIGILGFSTVGIHVNEVEGAVEAAGQVESSTVNVNSWLSRSKIW